MQVSKSAYYAYASGLSYQLNERELNYHLAVKRIFDFHKRRYGSLRIQADLRDEGIYLGLYKIRSIMRAQDLRAIQPKRFVPKTTQSHPHLRRSPNLLLLEGNLPKGPNEVYVGDITYLPCIIQGEQQWIYMAVWLDLFSRFIVGWFIDLTMEEHIITEALQRAINRRQPSPGLIIHSDGGGQYGALKFRALIGQHQFRQSMTRKDNHYDNAHIESLFSRLKAELLDEGIFSSLEDARLKMFDYIDAYYNTIRRHSAIGLISPANFEKHL